MRNKHKADQKGRFPDFPFFSFLPLLQIVALNFSLTLGEDD